MDTPLQPGALPVVPVLRDREIRSWPKYPAGGHAEYVAIQDALTRTYSTDAHFAAYSVPALERRLSLDALRKPEARAVLATGVSMPLLAFDVDCPAAHRGDPAATDSWWLDENEKVAALLAAHPGGFVYRTRGGYRFIYLLLQPLLLKDDADANGWSARYCAWVAYLKREFEIEADVACKDWTRLFRLPHATRDEGGQPERRETRGDAKSIGMWTCDPAREDLAAAKKLVRKREPRRAAAVEPDRLKVIPASDGVLPRLFQARGWLGTELEPGKWLAECPNEAQHTKGGRFDSSTVLFGPSPGEIHGWLHCSHAHCVSRSQRHVLDAFSPVDIEEAVRACRSASGIETGVPVALRDSGHGAHPATDIAVCAEPSSPKCTASSVATVPTRPVIDVSEVDLPTVSSQAWRIVADANTPPRLFRHAMNPARVREDDEDGVSIQHLGDADWKYEIARAARWLERDKYNMLEAVPPPSVVVRDMLAEPHPPLPVLTRVVRAPVFGRDGSLRTSPGYDPKSHTFYVPSPGLLIPEVPEAPSADDVARAKSLLRDELLCDFAFTGEAEYAHAVALGLEPFIRELFDGPAPLHLIEKPKAGTGATLLVDVLLLPALGGKIPKITEGRDEDEWRKRLTSKLIDGPQAVIIDNVRRPLDSGQLSSVITASVWEDRILGLTQNARIPVRCTWVATANNPVLSDEMARRAVRTRLDTRAERPWIGRKFRHPLPSWALENRGQLIWAYLVLASAWLAAGRPVRANAPMLGMFEGWSSVVGGVLSNAGIPGFLSNLDELYEGVEREEASWRVFVGRWFEKYRDQPVGVADLFEIADDVDMLDLGDGNDRSRRTKLGVALAKFKDRAIAGHRLVAAGDASNASLWRLVNVAEGSYNVQSIVKASQPESSTHDMTEAPGLVNVAEPFPGEILHAQARAPASDRRDEVHKRSEVQDSGASSPPTGLPPPGVGETRSCRACGGDAYWMGVGGVAVCSTCHPPVPGAAVVR